VQESGLPVILLGMSFLNRTAMRRDGESLTLTKRF
jgi:aspartyl protease family protein